MRTSAKAGSPHREVTELCCSNLTCVVDTFVEGVCDEYQSRSTEAESYRAAKVSGIYLSHYVTCMEAIWLEISDSTKAESPQVHLTTWRNRPHEVLKPIVSTKLLPSEMSLPEIQL